MLDVSICVRLVDMMMVTSNQNSSKHSIIIMLHFPDGEMEDLAALNSRVNIKDFQIPEDFDLETVVSAITTVSFI